MQLCRHGGLGGRRGREFGGTAGGGVDAQAAVGHRVEQLLEQAGSEPAAEEQRGLDRADRRVHGQPQLPVGQVGPQSICCCLRSSSRCISTTCGSAPGRWSAEEGEGFRQVFHGLNPERVTGAAQCVGIARYLLGAASRYARERQVWDAPIGTHQGVAHPLARAKIDTELAALMIRRACWQHDHGEPAGESANMAKYAAAEAAIAAADAAMQTHGGNGFATEYGLVPYWASARLLRVAPVNREMILNYVAQHSLGLPRSVVPRPRSAAGAGQHTQGDAVDLARNLIQRINVGDSLTRSAAARPAQPAVVDGPRRWTYAEFNGWVNQLARGLAGRGYRRGDALGLASANSAEFLAVYYACAKLGLVCVPINLGWRPEEVAYALDSGWNDGDRFAAIMPMFHTAQLNAFCTPAVMVGATIHVLRGFDPGVLLDLIEQEQITQVFGLPMMFRAMLDHPSFGGRDTVQPAPRGVRHGPHAGPADPPLPGRFRLRLRAAVRADRDEPGDHAVPPGAPALAHRGGGHADHRRAGRDHGPGRGVAGPGEQGEIVYRGPSTMSGYLHNEEATGAAFAHGWFHSGDVGRFGEDGVLWFADRYKDVIKTGGENVASIEVEKAVYAAEPRVSEAVVVGLPHEHWTEAITAVVVPRPGETIDPAACSRRCAGNWTATRCRSP